MKKNILIFGHGYATQFIDISNQYTKLFDTDKYEVTVAYLVGKADSNIKQQHITDQVIFIDSPKKSTRGLKLYAIKKILDLHREKNFEIVVCHRYKPTYIMLFVSLFKKIPLLFSVMHELDTLKSVSRKILIAALASKNTIYAGVSNAVRDNLRKTIWCIPKERVITLYNMIDVEQTEAELLSRDDALQQLSEFAASNLNSDKFIFGNIGRLAINKDQKTLIEAFAKIKQQCPNAKLLIIGEGILKNALQALVSKLNLSDDVIFTGFIPNGFRYLKACDVYISSSTQEAFGRVLLEAMVAKIPIIATRVNGVPEVVGNAGTLIDAANAHQLALAMLKSYNETKVARNDQGLLGYQRAVNDFSLQKFNEIFWNLDVVKKALL